MVTHDPGARVDRRPPAAARGRAHRARRRGRRDGRRHRADEGHGLVTTARAARALRPPPADAPDAARGRARRLADLRDLRLHRHDQRQLRPDLPGDQQGHRRRDHGRRSSSRPRTAARCRRSRARSFRRCAPTRTCRSPRARCSTWGSCSARTASGSASAARRTSSARSRRRRASAASTAAEGRFPQTADEAVIDRATAKKEDFKLGDRVTVQGAAPRKDYTLVGFTQVAGVDSFGGATIVGLIPPEAHADARQDGLRHDPDRRRSRASRPRRSRSRCARSCR